MPDESRSPVAIRIARPYTTEEDFLARELDTLTRTTVVLVGAQQKPQGVILRFELTLVTGEPLLRGEGRVVGYKQASEHHESGLTLRFTRLDARSKALVDRAAALRDARGRSSVPPAPAVAPAPPLPQPPPLPEQTPLETQAAHEEPRPLPSPPPMRARRGPPPLPGAAFPPPPAPQPPPHQEAATGRAKPPRRVKERPAPPVPGGAAASLDTSERDRQLERLRARAQALAPDAVAEVLRRGAAARQQTGRRG